MTTRSKCILLLVAGLAAATGVPRQVEARCEATGDRYHSLRKPCDTRCSASNCDCNVAES